MKAPRLQSAQQKPKSDQTVSSAAAGNLMDLGNDFSEPSTRAAPAPAPSGNDMVPSQQTEKLFLGRHLEVKDGINKQEDTWTSYHDQAVWN